MKCRSCSYENASDSIVCVNCGKALTDNPPPGAPSKRQVTRGEKILGFIAGNIVLALVAVLLFKLTGALWVLAIYSLFLFGQAPAVLRLFSAKTRDEMEGEVAREASRETSDLRSIAAMKDKIGHLGSQGGNENEIWRLHRRVAGMYDLAFIQSWANFDRIADGNLVLLAQRNEELIWARDHAGNDKDRQWADKNIERLLRKIAKWRARATKIKANPALLKRINRNYAPIIKKHYPDSGFDPEDYLERLNKAFPE